MAFSDSEKAALIDKNQHRRHTDQRLDLMANSSLLRVLQYLITGIMVPLALLFMNSAMTRLSKIEEAVQSADSNKATVELRLQTMERAQLQLTTTIQLLTEKVIGHTYEIQTLQGSKK